MIYSISSRGSSKHNDDDDEKVKKKKKSKKKEDKAQVKKKKRNKEDKKGKKKKKKDKNKLKSQTLFIPSPDSTGKTIMRKHYRWKVAKNLLDIFRMNLKLKANIDVAVSDEKIGKAVAKGIKIIKAVSSAVNIVDNEKNDK